MGRTELKLFKNHLILISFVFRIVFPFYWFLKWNPGVRSWCFYDVYAVSHLCLWIVFGVFRSETIINNQSQLIGNGWESRAVCSRLTLPVLVRLFQEPVSNEDDEGEEEEARDGAQPHEGVTLVIHYIS